LEKSINKLSGCRTKGKHCPKESEESGIAHTEVLLPSHAPPNFQNRSALWNSVEKIEKSKKSQLAREIEIAIRHNFLTGLWLMCRAPIL